MNELALEDQDIKPIIEGSQLIGGVYYMEYDTCTIVSNDRWKDDADGVPRHCYLLATAADWENPENFDEEDAYAMLLRAEGPKKLPAEDDLMKVREEAMRKKITGDSSIESDRVVPGSSEDIMDVLTRDRIQFSGIEAKILGTIYQEDNELQFGSDVETFYSSARYKVYKPGPEALAQILSEVQIDQEENEEEREGLRLGRVRYTSTERRSDLDDATVPIDIHDIIGNKTALFGMTRSGKSNTMKVFATASFMEAVETGETLGQLLFDPTGEYANINTQDDETALADIHDDAVTVYSWATNEDNVESLQMNFFDYNQIEEVWQTIRTLLTRDATYIRSFKDADVIGPGDDGDWGERNTAVRCRSALYATLIQAGFRPPRNWTTPIPTNQQVRDEINNILGEDDYFEESDGGAPGWMFVDADDLVTFWEIVANNKNTINTANNNGDWIDNDLDAILVVFNQERGSGYRHLQPLRRFHGTGAAGYYPQRIYESLAEGDIVIVDLTTGTDEINQRISKNIIDYIVEQQVGIFTSGEQPHDIQIYVEEAHRLFGSDYLDDAADDDPYVRLAKEAAKYHIGLVYATQEVTGVDDRVLANTANWIVTHLNNKNETKELSKYYDFEAFERLTREAEDKGFARVKTLSGEFIVPTQIDLFDTELIEQAGRLYGYYHGENEAEDDGGD